MPISNNQTKLIISALLISSFIISTFAASVSSPLIVAHKKATIKKLRNGAERVSVSIDIYNQGTTTVYDVNLVDDSWPVGSFNVISGNFSRSWESLEGGSVSSHSIELEPRVKGVFQGSPAVVTFRIPTKAKPLVAYSTPIFALDMLADTTPENKLEMAKNLFVRFGPPVSVVSLVALFGYIISTPSKSNAVKGGKKKR